MPKKAQTTVVMREKQLYLVGREGTANWQIHYKVQSLNKWLRKSAGTKDLATAKIVAEDFAADTRAAERRGYPVVSKKFKVVAEVVSAKFKEQIKHGTGKKKYADYYRAIDQYLIPFFGNYNVDRITPAVLNEFDIWRYKHIGRRLKQSTQNTHNLALNSVFDHAIESGYMTEYLRPKYKNTGEAGEARGFFTHEELIALQQYLQQWTTEGRTQATRDLRELLCLFVAFVAGTGVRPGTETKELQWRHIEFLEKDHTRLIHIHLPQGKTGARKIIARHELWPVLEKLRELQPAFVDLTLDQLIESKSNEYVFRMRTGERPYSFVNAFGDGIRAAGMLTNGKDTQERSLYSLRHYYATQRILEGYTYEELEAQMGTSADMLQKHYNHLSVLMIADRLAGKAPNSQGQNTQDTEILKYMNPAKSNMMGLIALTTGIYIPLQEQNPSAAKELSKELLVTSKRKV
jgi:integrase